MVVLMDRGSQITAEYARSVLRYQPDTGKLFWRDRGADCANWNSRWAGKEAFTPVGGPGYKQGSLAGAKFYAHRVIVLMMTGDWPEACVDHINGDKLDNRWSNLRAASRTDNNRNRVGRADRSGPHKGVRVSRSGAFQARIVVDKQEIALGTFGCPTAAALAYDRAAKVHFGQFASFNVGGIDARPL